MERGIDLVTTASVVLPGSTVGILGGGQLGRMLALAGRHMGYRFVVLDPTPDAPAAQVADRQIVAPFADREAARTLAAQADVITYEFEHLDANVVAELEARACVPQGSRLLRITQNRLMEKRALEASGIPVAPFREVASRADLERALDELGFPAVLKTATGGYDGKGQRVIRAREEAEPAYADLAGRGPLVLEAWVPFVKELSVVVARRPDGAMRPFPVAENVHASGILRTTIVPARVDEATARRATELACTAAERLNAVGLLAVEMFLTADGTLRVNELAPRPHNSGHFTMDACVTSQFEQHLRAICNLPLGDARLLTPVVMVNVLGAHLPRLLQRLPHLDGRVKVHLYGKAEARPMRKMGHVNIVADSVAEALAMARALDVWDVVDAGDVKPVSDA
ncbi:5-(carboxyamino)imidazole ribonucleotide synthase [Calditerricola satsumensis]|uniref:N5-carboxyaminoimidazole ribonucleotide synthase n=2 Tax=Calditerricola satsumensis TaxID=373054 RepID=A0A8J3BCE8_9BACI|nr:5-(carboxyamino)imidazole ribonucleotide synthase [Calditerricola satsumensis]GGK03746.1 N5-carboxyaminoimidazole ribonucleotide synthase [Calditerricola satsumensis]